MCCGVVNDVCVWLSVCCVVIVDVVIVDDDLICVVI